jgi:sugar lactone lactonase YvrE
MNSPKSTRAAITVIAAVSAVLAACAKAPAPEAAAPAAPAVAAAPAAPAEIVIPGTKIIPESLTSTSDGTVYIGSIGARQIYRAAPGAGTAEVFIPAGTSDMQGIFGVLADEASGTLYACSGNMGPPAEGTQPVPSALYAFDLATGAYKAHYPLPKAGGACNDIAVDKAGNAYATDTTNMLIVQLKKNDGKLEIWAGDGGKFGPTGSILDGVTVLDDYVIVNALLTSKLYSVPIGADGKAGAVTEVVLDKPVDRPDGMRAYGANSILVAEGGGAGRLGLVTVDDTRAKGTNVTLKEGFPDGPVAVTVVGDKAYVLEAQFAALRAEPGTPDKPFKATAVDLPKP